MKSIFKTNSQCMRTNNTEKAIDGAVTQANIKQASLFTKQCDTL